MTLELKSTADVLVGLYEVGEQQVCQSKMAQVVHAELQHTNKNKEHINESGQAKHYSRSC